MARFYAVSTGRVPGVYRTWAEASAQTNGFPGATHSKFSDINTAVEFSGIPLLRQPQWVREALGMPHPAPTNPTPAAGPPPPRSPSPASAAPSWGPQASVVTPPAERTNQHQDTSSIDFNSGSECGVDPNASLLEGLRAVSIQSRATPEPVHCRGDIGTSPVALTGGTGGLIQGVNREGHDQGAPAYSRISTEGTSGGPTITPGRLPSHSTPIASPSSSPTHSPGFSLRPNRGRVNFDLWSPHNHAGWSEDSILSGVFHPPASNVESSTENAHNGASTSRSTSPDEVWLDPMESMPGGLYGAQDSLPNFHRIALRTASRSSTHYAPALTFLLGQHAVNYMLLHYFSAGSTVVVANAYAEFQDDPRGFVEYMVRVGMTPRQAAYLWTIIAPESGDSPQADFSYFIWAATMRALARGGGSAWRGVGVERQETGGAQQSQDLEGGAFAADANDREADEAEAGDAEAGDAEAPNANPGNNTSPVQGVELDYMDIDDEIEYIDFPEENANP
ncbi:hypothetical protein M407DRAFT_25955 [Tulasnella calospora MUT 4182]|uniref:Ribonuclease H1 N-terminal domain-containing protein n=1 Tax=Tulasnella calospora MUT 4182 TaxID=1051891 RepID=A0A0C3QF77_9AGAM|nr:hypothetical protein M407DRAFT_25955 [Tulasnella calospora MUT 4182]